MKRIITLLIIAAALSGCRTITGKKSDGGLGGEPWQIDETRWHLFVNRVADRLNDDRIRRVGPPHWVLVLPDEERLTRGTARPYFLVKDVGSVSGLYRKDRHTAYLPADPNNPTQLHPWCAGDYIAVFHEGKHHISNIVGLDAGHHHPIFQRTDHR